MVQLGGREVDGMDGNTVAALVVGRAELDRDGGGWDGWKHGGAAGGESSREKVRGAAGRKIGG